MADSSAHLEAAAEAIAGAESRDPISWGELSDSGKDAYRHMAQAAIDSLQLAEEWAIKAGANVTRSMSENRAKTKAQIWPESFEAVCRLASPWVRGEVDSAP